MDTVVDEDTMDTVVDKDTVDKDTVDTVVDKVTTTEVHPIVATEHTDAVAAMAMAGMCIMLMTVTCFVIHIMTATLKTLADLYDDNYVQDDRQQFCEMFEGCLYCRNSL